MKKQSGYTLIEIMIASLIGLIIVAATIGIYTATVKSSSNTIKSARLNHDLESIMSLMVNDIRRAGYWGGAVVGANSQQNPFTIAPETIDINIPPNNFAPSGIAVMDYTDAAATVHPGGCILYSYDADSDGHYDDNVNGIFEPLPVDDTNEFYGFRLEGNTVEMRLTGTTTADCTNGFWRPMTINAGSENINVTALTFTTTYKCLIAGVSYDNTVCAAVAAPGQKAVESRQIDIVLTGQLANDATVTKTLTGTVKVRNNRIFTQP